MSPSSMEAVLVNWPVPRGACCWAPCAHHSNHSSDAMPFQGTHSSDAMPFQGIHLQTTNSCLQKVNAQSAPTLRQVQHPEPTVLWCLHTQQLNIPSLVGQLVLQHAAQKAAVPQTLPSSVHPGEKLWPVEAIMLPACHSTKCS